MAETIMSSISQESVQTSGTGAESVLFRIFKSTVSIPGSIIGVLLILWLASAIQYLITVWAVGATFVGLTYLATRGAISATLWLLQRTTDHQLWREKVVNAVAVVPAAAVGVYYASIFMDAFTS